MLGLLGNGTSIFSIVHGHLSGRLCWLALSVSMLGLVGKEAEPNFLMKGIWIRTM